MIQIKNLSKSYGVQDLFSEVSLSLGDKEKIGIIGRNGTGKSTFFKLILGHEGYDNGEILIPEFYTINTLEQNLQFTEKTLLEQVCTVLPADEVTGIKPEWKAKSILMGLGFAEDRFTASPNSFSGGYKIRIRLAEALVQEPDLLLLDEPTNYLDILSLRWLAQFLRGWKKNFMLITHNKRFMEQVVQTTCALHRGKIRKMKGGPTKLLDQIQKDEEVYEKTRLNRIKKQKKTEEFIRNFRAGARSAGLVQSRIKALEKQEVAEKLEYLPPIKFSFPCLEFRGKSLMEIRNICFAYPKTTENILDKFHLEVLPRERIAIIGKNGKGKSTLLKIMAGHLEKTSGHIKRYETLEWGYFGDESKKELDENNSIIAELCSVGVKEQYARQVAASLLFTGNAVKKQIKFLSGGEKSRVALGKIMLKKHHVLFLDEPSNHLDMESVQALISALQSFEGTVVFVSHDEQLLDALATQLVIFEPEGILVKNMTYPEFLEKIGWAEEEDQLEKKTLSADDEGSQKNMYQQKKELKKRLRMAQNMQVRLEEENKQLEKELQKQSLLLHKAIKTRDSVAMAKMGKITKDLDDTMRINLEKIEEAMMEELEIEDELNN